MAFAFPPSMRKVSKGACHRLAALQYGQWGFFSSLSKNGGDACGEVNSAIVGVYFLISEYAVRGASPSWAVKMSKVQARQTSVEYSVTVPAGKALRSSSRFFLAADME